MNIKAAFQLNQVFNWAWYPWLAALFPVIFLYSNNYGKVYTDEFLAACGVTVIATGLLVGLFWLVVRDIHRASALALVVIIPFFAYGTILETLSPGHHRRLGALPVPIVFQVLIIIAVLIVVVGVLIRARPLRRATRGLNLITAFLVLFNLGTLGFNVIQLASDRASRSQALSTEVRPPKIRNDGQHPDIYYIILDAYPSNEALMEVSEIDNTDFTAGLEQRGFYVAYNSRSNYPVTLPSLSSSLNMRYLEPGEGPAGERGVVEARTMIADNAVAQELLSRGYTYIFLLSGYDTASTIADLNIDYYTDGVRVFPRSGPPPADSFKAAFWPLLTDSTMLWETDFDPDVLSSQTIRPRAWSDPSRVLVTFDEATRIADRDEATFTIVHIMIPHVPIRITSQGEIISNRAEFMQANDLDDREAFIGQLEWLNGRMLRMLDDINKSSDTPPIIIIQGDHGSDLGRPLENGKTKYYRILNAYHLPGPQGQAVQLTQDITPVNSFRAIFDAYFGTDYGLLPNQYFQTPQLYEDVFDLVKIDTPSD